LTSIALLALSFAQTDKIIQTFTIEEHFGVSHPTQIIDFDFDKPIDPKNSYMLDVDGNEVPYQLIDNGKKIAIKTGLPAYTKYSWKLMSGKAPSQFPYMVKVSKTNDYYEIMNGIVGVRIPIPADKFDKTLAPIQGIRYNDGTWSAKGPNYLTVNANSTKNMDVRFIEQGQLKVIVEVSYTFDRPEYRYGDKVYKEAGEGYYKSKIEIQAGQQSILFEDDTDMELSYSLDVYEGLYPDQARYQGHHSTSAEYGYEIDGQKYRNLHERINMEAFVDLDYDKSKVSDYYSSENTWRRMAVWDPWVYDSGWYWLMYDKLTSPLNNIFGIFAGRPSIALGASNSGVGIFSKKLDNGNPSAGITISTNLRCPDARTYPRVRFGWGMFLGIVEDDLKGYDQIQPIAQQMNLHSGINLNKIHRLILNYPDPKQGYGAQYMDGEILQRIIKKVRTNRDYYDYLYNTEPSSRSLIDMWADPSGEKTKKALDEIVESGRNVLDRLVNGNGIYDFTIHYWHGGLEMMRKGLWIDQVLASGQLSSEEVAKAKSIAVLFAEILWDNDFVPLFDRHGLNLGTPNMPVQQTGYRHFYALFLANHPDMKERAKSVTDDVLKTVQEIINEHGAEMGCVHYIGASFSPTLNTLLQIRMLGEVDPFAIEPRLKKFAEFYLNFLTPPEVRLGNVRKYISVGDSSTESSELYGQLATGFKDADFELSKRLMGAWIASGKKHSGFFGTTLLMIDEEAPSEDPNLSNATYNGWYSVLRNGWNTKNETALWMVNGDFYFDHRHADQGTLVMYALGAPLSIDWGSIYYPRVDGGYMHSIILPESEIGFAWDQDSPALNAGDWRLWLNSQQSNFFSFDTCAHAEGSFQYKQNLTWRRSLTSIHPNPDYPIIIIRDSFEGIDKDISKVFTLNLMADGEVLTPAGNISPILRTYKNNNELPSAGQVFTLKSGLNKLGFTGQYLIDWDLYTFADENQQVFIGNWADNWHQEVSNFEERQHILRVKGNGSFNTLILPYRKGKKRDDLNVVQEKDNLRITSGNETTIIGKDFYTYQTPDRKVIATFNNTKANLDGIVIEGGQAEIETTSSNMDIAIHGTKGIRKITIPDGWKIDRLYSSIDYKSGVLTIDYQSDKPLAISMVRE
jgi:hypothetical protein